MYRSAAITAVSQIATMVIGAAMSLAVLARFGKGSQTDAAFAASGVYGALLVVCVGFRITIAPRLAEGGSPIANFDRYLGASTWLLLLSAILLVGLGDWLAVVIGGQLGAEAHDTIRTSLTTLWVALAAQLVSAMGAALLAVRGQFVLASVAYVCGAIASFVCVVALPAEMGVLVMPLGTAIGSIITGLIIVGELGRSGYTPVVRTLWGGMRQPATLGVLLLASVSPIAWQVNYVISLAFAARMGVGAVTLYTYAFACAGVVSGMTASAGGLVLAGQLAQLWDRRLPNLDAFLKPMLRTGLLIIACSVVAGAWVGADAIVRVLRGTLTQSDAETIITTFLCLAGLLVATTAVQVPMLAAFALGWYGRVGILLVCVSVIHFAVTAWSAQSGEVPLLGLSASISTSVALLLVLVLVYRRHLAHPLLLLAKEVMQIAGVCLIAFAPAALAAGFLGGGVWDAVCAALGVAAFVELLRRCLPQHFALATYIVRQVGGRAR